MWNRRLPSQAAPRVRSSARAATPAPGRLLTAPLSSSARLLKKSRGPARRKPPAPVAGPSTPGIFSWAEVRDLRVKALEQTHARELEEQATRALQLQTERAARLEVDMDAARRVLKEKFGHDAFRPPQEAAVKRLLGGHHMVLAWPPESGRHLCSMVSGLCLCTDCCLMACVC